LIRRKAIDGLCAKDVPDCSRSWLDPPLRRSQAYQFSREDGHRDEVDDDFWGFDRDLTDKT
jgi:hypothetical protein